MSSRALLPFASLVAIVVLAGACHKAEPPPVGLGDVTTGPLVFPPPLDGWKARDPLPTKEKNGDPRTVKLTSPSVEAGHIEVAGDVVRLHFDDTLVEDLKKAPVISISPEIRTKTVWPYGSSVELHALAPFDTATEYTITLPDLTTSNGRALKGFKVAFRPKRAIDVGGKTIAYVPERGKPRVLATEPLSDGQLGGAQELKLVYDQPVDLAAVRKLVVLEDENEKPLASSVSLFGGTTFEGQTIEARRIVVVRPVAKRAAGEKLVLRARGVKEGDEDIVRSFTIAKPTVLEKIGCGTATGCEVVGSTVLGSTQGDLAVTYSNPAPRLMRTENVRVSPAVKNMWASGWDTRLNISGSFAPSTRYTVAIGGGTDEFGGPVAPVTFTFETRPLAASLTMPEGPLLATEATLKAIPVTARNVERAEMRLFALPKGDVEAFTSALREARAGTVPSRAADVVVPFTPRGEKDSLRDLDVDVSGKVELGRVYLAQLVASQLVPKAPEPQGVNPKWSDRLPEDAPKAVTTLLVTASPDTVGAHVHQVGDKAVVQVFAQGTGEPTAGAKVTVGAATAVTDANGSALVAAPRPAGGDELVARVETATGVTLVPFGASHATGARALFPELSGAARPEGESPAPDVVGMIITDRGVYRPGSKISLKGIVRRVEAAGLRPLAGTKIRLHVVDGNDQPVLDEVVETSARGTIDRNIDLEKNAFTGRWRLKLELDGPQRLLVAEEAVRVAAYEAPRFKVDVEAQKDAAPGRVKAKVTSRYLFGGSMSGANVSWSLRKSRTDVPGGALADAGLSFSDEGWWWGERETPADKPVVGEGKLDAEGVLVVDTPHGDLSTRHPTELLLEADVSDASNRHVAGTARIVQHVAARYAGLRLGHRFGGKGTLRADLGVVDTKGAPVAGVKVSARLERMTWTRTAEKAESGALVEQWKDVAEAVGSCEATSGPAPVSCDLQVPRDGSYRVTTVLDGKDGVRTSYYAWSGGARDAADGLPSAGKKVPLVLDKGKYKAGETAKLLVQSPFPTATALLTVEQGGIVRNETKRVDGGVTSFEVPVSGASAPWVHAVVTLLPIGGTEADYRVGVVRVPVTDEGSRVDVKVSSAKPSYEVRDEAEITIVATKNGAPVKNADVTLAVVDEGVLRLTNHHAKDPKTALQIGRDLGFRAFDTRGWMLRRRERAHVAGGGEGGEDESGVRKAFAETAAFLPNLVTDGAGRVTAKVTLPDNLTEFRMMAIVVDDVGSGGAAESSFTVTKPVMLDPVMPRFAMKGDTFEAAAMVHNTTDAPVQAKVTVAGQVRDVTVPPKGRTRVGVPMTADKVGTKTMLFSVAALGKVRDKVELPLRIEAPGVDEHPGLSGVLLDKQEITVQIPADAIFEENATLSVKTGSALYPELGHRLRYLLDYPHGCVEQTTSSTIPLLAARTLLPWTGTSPISDDEITRRIRAGVERLATMTTPSGGLAYWPGGHEPNTFGSAYALRALVMAREEGIERPKLIDGIATYLVGQLDEGSADLRVSVAEALALAGKLPESSADSLWDLRANLDSFGTASLALTLARLPKQEDRVKQLLDGLEATFDEKGGTKKEHDGNDSWWWSSADRDRAQALLAFTRLRSTSKLAPTLASRLARSVDGYTTQSTAWSLLALSAYVGDKKPDGGVDVKLRLEGRILDTTRKLGGDNKEVAIPLRDLAGKKVVLVLQGDGKTPSAFALEATYRRPLDGAGEDRRVGRRSPKGASIHRAFTEANGKPLDLAAVKAGQVVRVALRIEMPEEERSRLAYVAVSDHIPAGLEPIEPDLASVARMDDLGIDHPWSEIAAGWSEEPSHVDLRDDRVQIYFDRPYGHTLFATYLTRATTPGTFALPPAHGERMYEPGSDGYSDAGRVVVVP